MPYDRVLADRLRELLEPEPAVTEKSMFGGLAFLVHGHMAVAANSRGGLMVRVRPDRSEALLEDPRAERMVMRGREMRGWIQIEAGDGLTDEELGRWLEEGVASALTGPS